MCPFIHNYCQIGTYARVETGVKLGTVLIMCLIGHYVRNQANRGFQLSRPAHTISLLEVTQSIGDYDCFSGCLLGLETCSDARNCPAHTFWKAQKARIKQMLQELTLEDSTRFELKISHPLANHDSVTLAPPTSPSSESTTQ